MKSTNVFGFRGCLLTGFTVGAILVVDSSALWAQRKDVPKNVAGKSTTTKKKPVVGSYSAEMPEPTPTTQQQPNGNGFNAAAAASAYSWSYDRNGFRASASHVSANTGLGGSRTPGSTSRSMKSANDKSVGSTGDLPPNLKSEPAKTGAAMLPPATAFGTTMDGSGKWNKSLEAIDGDRVVKIDASESGIKVVIKSEDGKEKTFAAKDEAQLKKLNQEAFDLYRKYMANDQVNSVSVNTTFTGPGANDLLRQQLEQLLKLEMANGAGSKETIDELRRQLNALPK